MGSILGGALGIIELAKVVTWLHGALDDGQGETVADQRDRARHDLDQLQLRFDRAEHERDEARVLLKEARVARDVAVVERDGAVLRAKMIANAKDVWMNRALASEKLTRELRESGGVAYHETKVAELRQDLFNAKRDALGAQRTTRKRRLALREHQRIAKQKRDAFALLRDLLTWQQAVLQGRAREPNLAATLERVELLIEADEAGRRAALAAKVTT